MFLRVFKDIHIRDRYLLPIASFCEVSYLSTSDIQRLTFPSNVSSCKSTRFKIKILYTYPTRVTDYEH